MNDEIFLDVIKQSFIKYLTTNARSNEKLKILHAKIAEDLDNKLKDMKKLLYSVSALGYQNNKEEIIKGRYIDKKVDITIKDNSEIISGIAVKYVMSNFLQNSNNYFENMLGETANIRSAKTLYFQLLIIPEKLPYFEKNGKIKKWESIDKYHLEKYIKLSQDNIKDFFHTPNKTLIYLISIPDPNGEINNKEDYINYYLNNDFSILLSKKNFNFGSSVIFNDYRQFIEKVIYSTLGI